MSYQAAQHAADIIRMQLPTSFSPMLGIILGTGSGALAEQIEPVAKIPYKNITGYSVSTVQGHQGQLIAGYLQGLPVVCLQGRVHFYEGAPVQALQVMIRSIKLLGCTTLLLTNAAGSLLESVPPGQLMLIKDHINFQGINPLVGCNDDAIGARFISMDNAYDQELRAILQQQAAAMSIPLTEGVYLGVLGPSFETHAEIRAFRLLGADAVGMSTIAEVILARHCGLKVACLSVISNFAAGMTKHMLTHEEHLATVARTTATLAELINRFAAHYLKQHS
jgi:xanthosine phosphorylase